MGYSSIIFTVVVVLLWLNVVDGFIPTASCRRKLSALKDANNFKIPKGYVPNTVNIDGEEYMSLTPFSHHPTVAIRHVKNVPDGIKVRRIPNSNLTVTQFGIGTATFGGDANKEEAFKMLDIGTKEYALNLIDTSELDPIPYLESTKFAAEKIVGGWMKKQTNSHRDQLVISTKICGFSNVCNWVRRTPNGQPQGTRINKKQVSEAVNAQLKRLNVDHIDLLQFQWPERYTLTSSDIAYNPKYERDNATPFFEQLEIVDSLIKAGKIRYFGLSNETPYGVAKFTTLADALNLPRPVSIQTPYSLLDRFSLEHQMMEPASMRNENLGIITYSPLAGGALAGKYEIDDRVYIRLLNTFRLVKHAGFQNRYLNPRVRNLLEKFYLPMAKEAGTPLAMLAIAWTLLNPFIVSTLLGASSAGQLVQNIRSISCVPMNEKALKWIRKAHREDATPSLGDFALYNPKEKHEDLTKMPFGIEEEDIDDELVEGLESYLEHREEKMRSPFSLKNKKTVPLFSAGENKQILVAPEEPLTQEERTMADLAEEESEYSFTREKSEFEEGM